MDRTDIRRKWDPDDPLSAARGVVMGVVVSLAFFGSMAVLHYVIDAIRGAL